MIVPDWFITSKMINKVDDVLPANGDIFFSTDILVFSISDETGTRSLEVNSRGFLRTAWKWREGERFPLSKIRHTYIH